MSNLSSSKTQLTCQQCFWRSPIQHDVSSHHLSESSDCPVCQAQQLKSAALHILDVLFAQAEQSGVLDFSEQSPSYLPAA